MKNEYGMELDRNGYAASIMQQNTNVCYLCKAPTRGKLDRHEPWGAANRQKSKALGLWVSLDHLGCHEGPGSVHEDGSLARELRRDAQRAAMLRYGWTREKWIAEFGKSELSEEEAKRLIILPKDGGPSGTQYATSSAPAGHLPLKGKALPGESDGERRTVGDIIADLFPEHKTNTQPGGFRVLEDAPLMPF